MLLMAIGVGTSGWPGLAGTFYLAALLFLVLVFIRADLFRLSPQKAWGVLGLTAVVVIVLWVKIRPSPSAPPLSISDLAKELARQMPLPPSVPIPTEQKPSPEKKGGKASSSPTPIRSYMYARFRGGAKNPLGVAKVFKFYYPPLFATIQFEAHFAVRYADPRPRLEIYTNQPIPYGHAAINYVIDHLAEIKKAIADASGFTDANTAPELLTFYPDFEISKDMIMRIADKARQNGLMLQVVWDESNGRKPNEWNGWAP